MIPIASIVQASGRLPSVAIALAALLLAPRAAAQTCDPSTSVGAHLSHTRANVARAALSCDDCHEPTCREGATSNVSFGPLARASGAQPRWNPATKTCSGVYCHGATLANPVGDATWAYVDPAVVPPLSQACVVCHGYPPASHRPTSTNCGSCHPSVNPDGTVDVAGGLHVDGKVDGGCGGCHDNPPATGAHLAHYGLPTPSGFDDWSTLQDRYPGETPTSAPQVYAFGCRNCHPADRHQDGTVDVVLFEAAAPAATLKARAATTASYDRATQRCSGVYCHSTGQATPVYVATPGWFSGATLGCADCHANPPAYPSGGAGTGTANSHLNLADDGYEFGHFLGMPGAWHTTKHGENGWGAGQDAAPITCQTCHYQTTDPSNTGPSGFYYLDTTGNYRLPGGDPGRISWGWQDGIQCSACHGAGGAATGSGRVLPLRHVNGSRDVAFDPRPSLPAIPWLPAAPNTPTRPYWITDAGLAGYWPANVVQNGSTVSFGLDASRYDPATKSCSMVACHVAETNPVWGTPFQYYTNSSATCYTCHPM